MAITKEGVRAHGGHIPPSQNSSQGGLMSAFFGRHNVGPGDQFIVRVVE